jgi:hypothetical protein
MHKHLEQKHFLSSLLPWKKIILNVTITTIRFQSKNVKNIPFVPCQSLKEELNSIHWEKIDLGTCPYLEQLVTFKDFH